MVDVEAVIREELERLSPFDPTGGDWARVISRAKRVSRPHGLRRVQRPVFATSALIVATVIAIMLFPGERDGHVSELAPADASAATVLRAAATKVGLLPDLRLGDVLYSSGVRTQLSSSAVHGRRPYTFAWMSKEEIWVGLSSNYRIRWTTPTTTVSFPSRWDALNNRADGAPNPIAGLAPAKIEQQPASTFAATFGMTLKELRALPDSPRRLARQLRAASSNENSDAFSTAMHVLVGPAKPETKAAMLRALAELPGVRRLRDATLYGHRLVRVALRRRMLFKRSRAGVLVDPVTGISVVVGTHSERRRSVEVDHLLALDKKTGQLVGSWLISVNQFGHLPARTILSSWVWSHRLLHRR